MRRALVIVLFCLLPAPPFAQQRPPVMGRNAGVSAGHPLTTAAAFEVLMKGGNAFDAGVAAMLVGGVVEQDLYSLGGEGAGPRLSASARQGHLDRRTGMGAERRDDRLVHGPGARRWTGIGLDPAVVPGVLHAALTVLERWGTMSFEQVSARAIEYAEKGFPLRPRTVAAIDSNRKFIDAWPDNKRDVAEA